MNHIRIFSAVIICLIAQLDIAATSIGAPVDLGLPSGTLWSNMNLGASSLSDYGDFFAWGETAPKEDYKLETYKWYQSWTVEPGSYVDEDGFTHETEGGTLGGYNKYVSNPDDAYKGICDNKRFLDNEDDAAREIWGANWSLPTHDQFTELKNHCSWEWVSINDVFGYKVTGINGNFIFLPAAGFKANNDYYTGTHHFAGSYGIYLINEVSNDMYTHDIFTHESKAFYMSETNLWENTPVLIGHYAGYRAYGHSIRPVYSGTIEERCEVPTVTYQDGKLLFASSTPNCSFVSTIKCSDAKTTSVSSMLSLEATYDISVYTTAPGYQNSEPVSAYIVWRNAEISLSNIDETFVVSSEPILISQIGGSFTIKGLIEDELISVYTLEGNLIYNHYANSPLEVFDLSSYKGEVVIFVIGQHMRKKCIVN